MERKIKLVWEFRGRDVEHFARHHAKHLSEFASQQSEEIGETGFEVLNEIYAIAFIIIQEGDLMKFGEILKPHKAVYA